MTFSIDKLNRCAFSHFIVFFFLNFKKIIFIVHVSVQCLLMSIHLNWIIGLEYNIRWQNFLLNHKRCLAKSIFPTHFSFRNIFSYFVFHNFSFSMSICNNNNNNTLPKLSNIFNIQNKKKYSLVGMNILKFLNWLRYLLHATYKTDWIFSYFFFCKNKTIY